MRRGRTGVFLAALWAFAPLACSGAHDGRTPVSAAASTDPGAPPAIDGVTPLPSPLPDVVARVNGQPIGAGSVTLVAEQALQSGSVPRGREPLAYRQALQQMIVRELLFQEAMKRGMVADEARLEQVYNETRVRYKDDAAWAALLAQQGLDPQSFRKEMRVQHTVQALLAQVAKEAATPSDQEALAFYGSHAAAFDEKERVRAAHILVRVPQQASAARKAAFRKKAEALLARLRKGEDFSELARKSSQDLDSAAKGGDLGELRRGQIVGSFENAAFALQPGEVSDVVETAYGFHIIKVQEQIPARHLSFEEVKEQLKRDLALRKQQEAQQSLVSSLRAKAKIETFL